jgi:uncharacterized sulfatase
MTGASTPRSKKVHARARRWTKLAVLALALPLVAGKPAAADPLPNILLVIGDDVGWPYYGFMGHPLIQTPVLDQLAAEGTWFPVAYTTSSLCRPSNPGILTGLHNFQMPVVTKALDTSVATIANQLHTVGYINFHGGKSWPGGIGFLEREYGFDDLASDDLIGVHEFARQTLDPLNDFIDQHVGTPKFIWAAPFIPHAPHDPPPWAEAIYANLSIDTKFKSYFAAISQLDDMVGDILTKLDEVGERDNTVTIYLSDNGYGLPKSKGKFTNSGYQTPIILHDPRSPGKGQRSEFAHAVDVFPTILDLAGVPLPPGPYEGLPLHKVGDIAWRTHLMGQHTKKFGKVLESRHIRDADGFRLEIKKCGDDPKLWDLNQYPFQQKKEKDLQAHAARVATLTAALDAWWNPCTP